MNLADAHVKAVDYIRESVESAIFNLGNGKGFSVLDVIQAAERITGQSISVKIADRREGDPSILVGSAEKAKKFLGWIPNFTSIDDIIATAWNWHKKMK